MTRRSDGTLLVPTTLGGLHVQDGGPADGNVALLWPSVMSDGRTSWGAQLPMLHDHGWRTLLVDPPGTGRSATASRDFTMEECSTAAIQILDTAAVNRAAILGLSWGGFVGLRLALAAPERVVALVLSNTSARRPSLEERKRNRQFADLIRDGVLNDLGGLIVSEMLSEHSRRADPTLAAQFAAGADQLDRAGLAHVVRSVLADRTSVVDTLDQIAAPALVIAGAEDQAFSREHAEELAERIPSARLQLLPYVGHLAPREAPNAVAVLLEGFLAPLDGKDRVGNE